MVSKYKIIHDRESCIGCGACASVCPNNWEMNSDGKSDLKEAQNSDEFFQGGEIKGNNENPLTESYDCDREAADSCPVNCIHIHEVKEDGSDEKLI